MDDQHILDVACIDPAEMCSFFYVSNCKIDAA
jgi:hypothetical protein